MTLWLVLILLLIATVVANIEKWGLLKSAIALLFIAFLCSILFYPEHITTHNYDTKHGSFDSWLY